MQNYLNSPPAIVKSQWQCVLENLGDWVGSFTLFSSQGELIKDIPSHISLQSTGDNQGIHLILKRWDPSFDSLEPSTQEVVLNFSSPNPGALFFETGAFSDGWRSILPGVNSIAEFCLVGIDRRLRMVLVFTPDRQFARITLIREQRQGTNAPEREQLTSADLLGTWQGTAITLTADDRSATITNTESTLTLSDSGYQWVENSNSIDLRQIDDRLLEFDRDGRSYQLRLFPDGSYCITPRQIDPGQPFYLESGWVHQKGQRQRLVRRYDGNGSWIDVTWIVDGIQNRSISKLSAERL